MAAARPDLASIYVLMKVRLRGICIYQRFSRHLIDLCEPFVLNRKRRTLNQPRRVLLTEEELWFQQLYSWLCQWSSWTLINTLIRWNDLRTTLRYLQHTCPPGIKEQSAESLIVQDFFEPGIGETLHAVRQLLSSTEHVETAMRLESASAMPLIELLDQVMSVVDLDDHLFLSAFHTLKKLCALHLYLPRSFMFTDDLRKMSDQAETSGAFADIWHGCYNGLNVAVKSIRIFNSSNLSAVMKGFCTEAVIWRHLSHPNVTPFLGINTTQFRLSMVCKWMPKGNIRSYIHAHPSADRPMLVMDVARGLEYLHSMGVVHGDMKGANILVNGEGRACLSDFGLAAVIYDDSTVNVATTASFATGTIRWMAPEILDPERAGIDVALALPESDVYSYAMVVWEIFTGRSPFDKQRLDAAVMYQILSGVRPEYTPEAIVLGLSEDMWQLIELCWHPDRSQRPNMYEVVSKLRTILRIPSTPASKHPRRRRELQNLHVTGAIQRSSRYFSAPPAFALRRLTNAQNTTLPHPSRVSRRYPNPYFYTSSTKGNPRRLSRVSHNWWSQLVYEHSEEEDIPPGSPVNLLGQPLTWNQGELVGWGPHSQVFIGYDRSHGDRYVKIIAVKQTRTDHSRALDACQLQLAILYNADHVNIIQLLGSEHKSGFFYFFLEYVPGGTLTNCIQLHGNLEEETTKFFLRQILAGLEYLHTNDVIHGNLQAEHILITDTGVCKITGFGLARHITIDESYESRKPMQLGDSPFWLSQSYASIPLENFVFWMAPELVSTQAEIMSPRNTKKDYDNRIDTWSIGCVVHELWTGQPPWQSTGLGPMSVLRQLYFSRQTPPLPDTILVSLLAGDFRNRCFLAEPGERPSAELLMKHPYLTLTPGWQFKGFSADPEPDVR